MEFLTNNGRGLPGIVIRRGLLKEIYDADRDLRKIDLKNRRI